MRPGMKAGLIGAVAAVMLTTIGRLAIYLPQRLQIAASCCACAPFFLVYPAIGALASHWEAPPRSAEQGAWAGGLAGLVAGSIDSVFSVTVNIALALSGGSQRYLQQLSPAEIEALRETGLINLFGTRGQIGTVVCLASVCLVGYIAVAAIAGAIYGAARRGVEPEPAADPSQ